MRAHTDRGLKVHRNSYFWPQPQQRAGTDLPDSSAFTHHTLTRASPAVQVVYAKSTIADIPDTWANRREMFKELDRLEEGWQVELRARGGGDTVDAIFYDPAGLKVGSYAAARRQALTTSKAKMAAV